MEVVFPLELPNLFRCVRFRAYRRFPTLMGLRLREIETDRMYFAMHREAADAKEREAIEYEHMYASQELDEERACHISDTVYATAKRLHIERPPLTGKDDDPNWEQCTRIAYGRHFLKPAAVEMLRAKVRAEQKARWEPVVRWSGWIAAIVAFASKYV